MFRCKSCQINLSPYCTKNKSGKKIRYYKCPICGKGFKTFIEVFEKHFKSSKRSGFRNDK